MACHSLKDLGEKLCFVYKPSLFQSQNMMGKIELLPLRTIPEVKPGDDLGEIIFEAARREIGSLQNQDIAVVTMKIVSKAEGCLLHLDKVTPSEKAKRIAEKTGKPVQLIQAILDH